MCPASDPLEGKPGLTPEQRATAVATEAPATCVRRVCVGRVRVVQSDGRGSLDIYVGGHESRVKRPIVAAAQRTLLTRQFDPSSPPPSSALSVGAGQDVA
jgi:hypothetical protein